MSHKFYPLTDKVQSLITQSFTELLSSCISEWIANLDEQPDPIVEIFDARESFDLNKLSQFQFFKCMEDDCFVALDILSLEHAFDLPKDSNSAVLGSVVHSFVDSIYSALGLKNTEIHTNPDILSSILSSQSIISGPLLIHCVFYQLEFVIIAQRDLISNLASLQTSSSIKGNLDVISEALMDQLVSVDVKVGNIETTAAAVSDMKVGNIFILDSKVESPLTLRVGDQDVCHAYLGKCQDKKALVICS